MLRQPLVRAALLGLLVGPALGAAALSVRADDASQVTIKTFKYGPKDITVKAGTTVTWTNKDPEPHTVVDKGGKFRSAALDTDDSFSFTFKDAGTYQFFCTLHPQMTGTVTVTQ